LEAAVIRVARIAVVGSAVLVAALEISGTWDFARSPYTAIQHHNLTIQAVETEGPNRELGLAPGDRILSVNGVRPRNVNDYTYLVFASRNLAAIPFVVARGDSTFQVMVRTAAQPPGHVLGKLSLLAVAFSFILMGSVVFVKRPDILGALFTVNCLIFSFLITERPITPSALAHVVGELVYDFMFIFLPAFFLHFFLLFPGREIEGGTRRSFVVKFLYLPPALLSLSTFVLALWRYSGGASRELVRFINGLEALTVLYWVVYIVASLAVFVRTYVISERVQRVKFRIVIVGVALGVVPLTVLMLIKQFQPTASVSGRYLWPLFLSSMPISFAYAILKHDAFDLGIVVRKGLVYGMLLLFVIVIYYGCVNVLGEKMVRLFSVRPSAITAGVVALLALAMVPVRTGLQKVVDRAFSTSRKAFAAEAISFSRQIQYLTTHEEIARFVTNEMRESFGARHAHIFLREETGSYELSDSAPYDDRPPLTSFGPGTDLIKLMREERLPLMLEYFDRLWLKSNLDRISLELIGITQASVVLPLIEQGELLGFVIVGPKSSGKPYSRADAEILELLGERCAVALTNVRLCRDSIEKEKLDEELKLASDIQARLLPESPPSLRLATVAGAIRTSREVGGDFYDFLEFKPGKIGIAVADVSGKGIPAALLMTTLQASFRSEALKSSDPGTVVAALNRSLFERSDPEKFATFFYAVYDDEDGIVRYSNGGSYPPFILGPDGRISRLQRGGILIGIEHESSYGEGAVKLKPGDLLIVYTDGFIDQEDTTGEPFGEERLVDFFRNNLRLSVDAMIEKLFATIVAFGQNNLKDDMTVVLLRRNNA
jgi:sigma-B regulation protein RsbU (phosphoserine phosphatase)